MKRKHFFIIWLFLTSTIILLVIGVFLIIEKSKQNHSYPETLIDMNTFRPTETTKDAEKEDVIKMKGIIVRVNESSVLINESPSRRSLCKINLTKAAIYLDGKKSDISNIKLGQTVEVTISGGICESYPAVANDVIKFCATTEDVSLLEGTVTEVDKNTILIQDNVNTEKIYKLSLSNETFVCIRGLDASIQGIRVGQNVEVACKEGTDEELPSATIVLVK